MSPRPKHIPDHAHQTTICLTDEEQAAINWIKAARRARGEDRRTLNDIFIDALWYLLRNSEGKSREEIRAMVPQVQAGQPSQNKVTEMPRPTSKR
jgi:hypothetical protein